MPDTNHGGKRKLRQSTDARGSGSPHGRSSASLQQTPGASGSGGAGKEKKAPVLGARQQSSLDKWMEPPLAPPKASYQDHGGAPYGVLEQMQPLGEGPSAKTKARARAEGGANGVGGGAAGTRKSLLANRIGNSEALASSMQNTPEGSPVPPSRLPEDDLRGPGAGESSSSQLPDPAAPPIFVDDEKDKDYKPKAAAGSNNDSTTQPERRTRLRASRSAARQSSGAPAAVAPAADSPVPTMEVSSPVKPKTPPSPPRSPAIIQNNTLYDLRQIVEDAKQKAWASSQPDVAEMIDDLYQQSYGDDKLKELMCAILGQTATPAQHAEFQVYVRASKKKLKKAKQLRQRQHDQPSTHPEDSPIKVEDASTARPRSSPAANDIPHIVAPPAATQASEPRKPKISLKVRSPAVKPAPQAAPAAPQPQPTLPVHTAKPVSPKKRSDSVGSDSSLTSFTSNEESPKKEQQPSKIKLHPSSAHRTQQQQSNAVSLPSRGAKRSSAEAGLESDDDFIDRAKGNGAASKRSKAKGRLPAVTAGSHSPAESEENARERILAAKKQQLSATITRDPDVIEESHIRPVLEAPLPVLKTRQARISAGLPSLQTDQAKGTLTPNGSFAMPEDDGSPLTDLSPASSDRSSPPPWHNVTFTNPATNKPSGKRAKTKQSPEKKTTLARGAQPNIDIITGGSNGIGIDSPAHDDDNEEVSENNDFCSACGASGYLLCCDGCDRSFHFTCLDPPISEDDRELDEPWFCYVCSAAKRSFVGSPEKQITSGLFAPLLAGLKKQNPTNFMLPLEIRDYFEGVACDKNGSFIESLVKTTRQRPGYGEEQPDYYKDRDSKGNLILCYNCGLSSRRQYAIITCDFCSNHWHLDCLDPPLANPPAMNQNGRKAHDWMCPLHADQELRNVDVSILNRQRHIHLRKPRNVKVVEANLSRGFRNNGIVEILEDDSDSTDSEYYEHENPPVTYKLSAKGIKLDFIDKVKSTRVQQLRDAKAHRRQRLSATITKVPSALEQANFARRPFVEQQLALQLTQFASEHNDLDFGLDQLENLVGTLIAEAPAQVIQQMIAAEEEADKAAQSADSATVTANVPPSPPSSEKVDLSGDQRKKLELLQELIRRKLECGSS